MASNYGEDDMDKRKPRPEMLGTGTAASAGKAIRERRKANECAAYGGMYDFASGKCKQDNE